MPDFGGGSKSTRSQRVEKRHWTRTARHSAPSARGYGKVRHERGAGPSPPKVFLVRDDHWDRHGPGRFCAGFRAATLHAVADSGGKVDAPGALPLSESSAPVPPCPVAMPQPRRDRGACLVPRLGGEERLHGVAPPRLRHAEVRVVKVQANVGAAGGPVARVAAPMALRAWRQSLIRSHRHRVAAVSTGQGTCFPSPASAATVTSAPRSISRSQRLAAPSALGRSITTKVTRVALGVAPRRP